MADAKITALTALTGAAAATNDVLVVDDVDAAESKKITLDELRQFMAPRQAFYAAVLT